MSSISSLSIALRGLLAHQVALNTTAHNIGNANTEGYSVQQVRFQTAPPMRSAGLNLVIGTGVDVNDIRRMRDVFVDLQFRTESQRTGRAEAIINAVELIESMVDDPSDNGINTSLTRFFNAFRDVSNAPEDTATRTAVAETADNLAFVISRTYDALKALQTNLDQKVGLLVGEINTITSQIVDLNAQIARAQSGTATPNDLLDRRDLLIDQLSRIVPVTVSTSQQAPGVANVSVAGVSVVQGTRSQELDTQINGTTGFSEVVIKGDTFALTITGGELGGVTYARDTEAKIVIDDLNSLSEALIRETNRIHRGGFGLEAAGVGNVSSVTSQLGTTGVYTIVDDGLGNLSATYTPDGGSAGPAVTGTISASGTNSTLISGLTLTAGASLTAGTMTVTVSDGYVLAGSGSLASVSGANGVYKLTTDATASTVDITFTPTGGTESAAVTKSIAAASAHTGLITGLTITTGATLTDGVDYLTTGNNFFQPSTTGADAAASIRVLSAIKSDPNLVAASGGYDEPGNTAIAVALGQLEGLSIAGLGQSSIPQCYQGRVASLGARAQQERGTFDNQASLLRHIEATRSSVSLDEETANLIRFQRSFQASARVLTTIDQLLDQVINRMGLVGR